MARILGIDYGTKRTGIATTDPLQLFASGLETVATDALFDWLKAYLEREEVEKIVVGEPLYPDGNPAQTHHLVIGFTRQLRKLFPTVEVVLHDERFTSEDAKAVIRQSGAKKKKRQNKALVDQVSAALILKDYLGY
ncbi:MAG: Holliday junction resolvase RuvX [Saprospiraceae bacterium]